MSTSRPGADRRRGRARGRDLIRRDGVVAMRTRPEPRPVEHGGHHIPCAAPVGQVAAQREGELVHQRADGHAADAPSFSSTRS